jgi:hypothetical protein
LAVPSCANGKPVLAALPEEFTTMCLGAIKPQRKAQKQGPTPGPVSIESKQTQQSYPDAVDIFGMLYNAPKPSRLNIVRCCKSLPGYRPGSSIILWISLTAETL